MKKERYPAKRLSLFEPETQTKNLKNKINKRNTPQSSIFCSKSPEIKRPYKKGYNINDEIITETPFNYFYDNIIILTNYVFTTYHKAFNNQYNILFDNKYTNFYNPLKECTDYIVNYLPITTINDNCETEVDYYVNANTISINLLPYIKLILNETLSCKNLFSGVFFVLPFNRYLLLKGPLESKEPIK